MNESEMLKEYQIDELIEKEELIREEELLKELEREDIWFLNEYEDWKNNECKGEE